MTLTNYEKMCYRWFGRIAEATVNDKLKNDLEKAHIEIRAGAYISYAWFNTIITAIISSVIYFTLIIILPLDFFLIFILLLIPISATVMVYLYYKLKPAMKAKSRAKKIDLYLPYALNFISAMSSAGITPTEIFKSLSKQSIYGEIKEEALWIVRDINLLGKDIISAIKANINRTPSEKFKEFLQGAIVTVQSGGALKPYFMAKAEQYSRENRIALKQLLESLGIMAEAYVTAAVSGVLLIIIIIPLLMIISKADASQLTFMYIFIFMIIPLIHIGFSVVLSGMSVRA
ncbi:MAG: type II secretion system F family protein [Candidatus Thermoplasmatota archaeon]|nr:type II secretion system F family protein [Candidatus Thermoplasmatota archaeon]